MKRKGRPSLAESLAKQPLDAKQGTLACTFSIDLNPHPALSSPAAGSATSASTSSPAAPVQPSLPNVEVAQFSSTLYGECSESVVLNGSTTCGYSELGSSASACGRSFEEVAEQLHRVQGEVVRLRGQLDRFLQAEVALVLEDVLAQVVDENLFVGVKKYYHRHATESKQRVVQVYRNLKREEPNAPVHLLMAKLRAAMNDADLSWRSIRRWSRQGPLQKRGRKVNDIFETRVLESLVYSSLDKVDNVDKSYVVANICYGYDAVKAAAQLVQKSPEFAQDVKVQKLKFSNAWVQWWLRRRAMRRRRCTTQIKELPPPEVIQATMSSIQQCIDDNKYKTSQIVSGDDTAMLFGLPPKNQYVPHDAERAVTPVCDEKARFTSFLFGCASGMYPSFNIVKCA